MSTPAIALRRHSRPHRILLSTLASAMGALSCIVTVACGQYVLHTATVPSYDWTIEVLLTVAIAGIGVVLGAWLTIWAGISVFCVVGATIGRRSYWVEEIIATHGPLFVRRLVAAALGVGLTMTAGPAFAAQDDMTGPALSSSDRSSAVTALGWHNAGPLSGPTGTPHTGPAPQKATSTPAESSKNTVVVHPGDSLWSITAQHLPVNATDADIAAAWPAWFELNQDVIGSEPGLILPGQELLNPSTTD